jgi:ATP-dependent Lhr-like helicase
MPAKSQLDPEVESWFRRRFAAFTEVQRLSLRHTLKGSNTLILAPTGSGKTLAAFLPVLSRLARDARSKKGLGNVVRAVYVSPLKALGRDIHRNLTEPLKALNATLPPPRQIRLGVRTGDTTLADRNKQERRRPHLLITTPESLSTILSQSGWHGVFDVEIAIVDEVHAFAENKRGSLLALTLERLRPKQRIGLSATAWPTDAVARLLCGDRPCVVASVDLKKAHRLTIEVPPEGQRLPPAGYGPTRIAPTVADLVAAARCSLAFTTTRSAAERLGLALGILLPEWETQIAVHHGSVDKAERLAIETGLAEGKLKAVVCSSSLELGVDFAAVDQVLLIGAPHGVSRAMQRLGRSGHRVDGVAAGSLVPLSLPDVLQCIALREGARTGRLDALRIPRAPIDVMAQVLLGMSIEPGGWSLDDAFELVRRAGPYRDLPREEFDSIIEFLAGGGKVLGGYDGAYGKILLKDGRFHVASKRVAREYYMNAGVISDDIQIRVVTGNNHRLGEVEEGFLASLKPGEAFAIGGKSVKIKRLHPDVAIVQSATGERVKVPRWGGNKMPLTLQLAKEELALRRALRSAFDRGGAPECIAMLKREWKVTEAVAQRAVEFVARQTKAAPIPIDQPVQIERVISKRTLLLLVHVVAGRAINRSLAWVAAHRLAPGSSVSANFDDHSFLLALDRKTDSSESALRKAFDPKGWAADLRKVLETTDTLGRGFRPIAEIGQLMPRRSHLGPVSRKSSTWNGALLYKTFMTYEPDHPLVRECIRKTLEDECDAEPAALEAARIFESPFEIYDLPRPSPFALPLFAAFNREPLLAQDPERALDDYAYRVYEEWGS